MAGKLMDDVGLAELWSLTKAEDAKNAKILTGTYIGDGTKTRTISLGVTPKALLVSCRDGSFRHASSIFGGLAVTGISVAPTSTSGEHATKAISIVDGGFTVGYNTSQLHGSYIYTNESQMRYTYLAIL